MGEDDRVLHVPARVVPVPTSVSAEAQAVLAMGPLSGSGDAAVMPALDDVEGWRSHVAASEESILRMFEGNDDGTTTAEERDIDGVHVCVLVHEDADHDTDRVCLEIHGGAWTQGRGKVGAFMSMPAARRSGVPTWAVDYRMPPDHPYPAPLDDCLTVYGALLRNHAPERIVVGGISAGGNLAAAMVLRARDEGLPLPAGLVLHTPVTDLTGASDSVRTNLGVDTVLGGELDTMCRLYAHDADLADPYVSPLFGDFSEGYPPTLLTTGTRDRLLSDTVRLHRALRAADIPAELHVLEAAPHGGFFGVTPEERELDLEVRRFVDAAWGRQATWVPNRSVYGANASRMPSSLSPNSSAE